MYAIKHRLYTFHSLVCRVKNSFIEHDKLRVFIPISFSELQKRLLGKMIIGWSSTPGINKANLRDLIAATSLVISLKLDSNLRLISPCDLEI